MGSVQGEEKHSVWHDMSFFIKKENGQYERFNESHYQRTYSKNEYIDMLKQTGFTKIKTFLDFDINNKDDENGHRLFLL